MPPAARPSLERIALRPIGHVRTAYRRMEDTPIQTSRNPDEPGRLVLLEEYADALDGLEEFDYAHLICFLDGVWRADGGGTRPFAGDRLRPVPFLLQVGVFLAPVGYTLASLSGTLATLVEFNPLTGVIEARTRPIVVLTSNTYGHVLEARQREVARAMDAMLG